ncbi:MAG TPA: bifunctional nicotinamidase/pyrazinamidase [Afifellaceae bacterium]|nr:bifunctional nicotinamidase/pyrazinamidase [Afifellaceae bacterium]
MTDDLRPRPDDLLLVVDVQNDFCPGGRLAVPKGDEVVPVIARLAQRFDHVALTQDWHPPGHRSFASSHPGREPFETIEMPYGSQVLWPDHCVQGSQGAAFHPGLDTDRAEIVIRKGFRREIDSYSTFFENDHTTSTGLAGFLRDRSIKRVVLCGLATDFCVGWSAIDARRLGFEVVVVEDATRAIDLDGSLDRARREMMAAGVQLASMERLQAQA